MKANFNIAKNVRNSRSISALGALRKLQSIGLLLCALMIGSLQVWGATDEIYKTAKFGSSYNSGGVSSYTASWSSTNDGFTVNIANGNNNNNGWNYIKFGRKNNTSVGTIITDAKIDKAVTKVTLTISAITATTTNSIKLYTSSNNSTWTEAGSFTKSSGAQTVELASPTANLHYKIEFDCASGSGNGFITVTQVDYYITSGPTLYTVTFDANGGSVTPASATQASAGAAVTLPTPTRSGYNCTGWYTATSGGTKRGDAGGSYTPTASETIHAQWSAKTYSNYRTLCSTTDPTITVSPTSIDNLDYIWKAGPSAAQNITLGGSNLTASVTITAPTNFEISTDGGSTYGDSRTVTQTGGVPDVSTVKVRLKSGLAVNTYGSASTYVTFASTGATTKNVSVIGHVLQPTITASPGSITGWNTETGSAPSPATQTVSVTGVNLKADISVSLTSGSDYFSIDKSSFAQTSGSASGTITISVKAAAYASAATRNGNIRLTSTDATTVDVPITLLVQDDPREKFELLTSSNLSQLSDGAKIVLVYDDYDSWEETHTYYAMTETQDGSNGHTQTTTGFEMLSANTILAIAENNPQSVQVLELVETATPNIFALYTGSTKNTYLYNSGDKKLNEAANYTNDNAKWSISVDGDGYAIIDAQGGQSQQIGYNSGASGAKFRCYSSGYSIYAYFQPSVTPSISVSPSSLSGFTYVVGNGPSATQDISVSGLNLTGDLTVKAPSNYQVSTDGGSTWSTSGGTKTISASGTLSATTVKVRLVAGLSLGTYNDATGVKVYGGGVDEANAKTVSLAGNVTNAFHTVTISAGANGSVSPSGAQSVEEGQTLVVTATPNTGYSFSSWTVTGTGSSCTSSASGTFTMGMENATLTANFAQIMVSGITVEGNATVKTLASTTYTATVLPAGALTKTVTWSVTNGTGTATINSSTGELTAGSPGTVTVRATATDGSGVYGELAVTIQDVVRYKFVKMTSTPSPWEDDEYLIVNEGSNTILSGSDPVNKETGTAGEGNATSVTINKSTSPYSITLEDNKDDAFHISYVSTKGYLVQGVGGDHLYVVRAGSAIGGSSVKELASNNSTDARYWYSIAYNKLTYSSGDHIGYNSGSYRFYTSSTADNLVLYRLEALYTVTCNTPSNGTLTSDMGSAASGTTVTLTVTPSSGYELSALTITKDGGGTVTPTKVDETHYTFTMPKDNVTVEATFVTIQTKDIIFHTPSCVSTPSTLSGKATGATVTLPSEPAGTPDGYTFLGWVLAEQVSPVAVQPTTYAPGSYTVPSGAANINMYALYSEGELSVSGSFSNITTLGSLTVPGYYVIGMANSGSQSVLSNTLSGKHIAPATITPSSCSNAAAVWEITKPDSYWRIKNISTNTYVASTGTEKEATLVADGSSDAAKWTATATASGYRFESKLLNDGSYSKKFLGYSASATDYRTMASGAGGDVLYLFKAGGGAVTDNTTYTTDPQCYCDYRLMASTNSGSTWSEVGCFTKVKPNDDTDHEWRLSNFTMPAHNSSTLLKVQREGYDYVGQTGAWQSGWIPLAELQGGICTYKAFELEGAVGTLRIYDVEGGNSVDANSNFYLGFYPTYQITHGVDGGGAWANESFELVDAETHKYQTAVTTAPAGYFADNNYKFYIGARKSDGTTKYASKNDGEAQDKSNTQKMNTMGGMTSDVGGRSGVYQIYSNSCDQNWYCSFIPYYVVYYHDVNGNEIEEWRDVLTSPTTTVHAYASGQTGWATSQGGAASATYNAGASITPAADVHLYQVASTYTVTYSVASETSSIGGTSVKVIQGQSVTLPTITFSCGLYDTHVGWVTGSDIPELEPAAKIDEPSTLVGAPGASFTPTADVTLKALYGYECDGNSGWQKQTTISAGRYVIAASTYGFAGLESAVSSTTNQGSYVSGVSISDGTINEVTGMHEVEVILGNAGTFAIKYSTGQYMEHSSGYFNGNVTSLSSAYRWKLDASGQIYDASATTMFLQINNSNHKFKCYAGTQTNYAYLYKYIKRGYYTTNPTCATPTELTVTFNANSPTGDNSDVSNMPTTIVRSFSSYPTLSSAINFSSNPTPTCSGYTIQKWNTAPNGSGQDYALNATISTFSGSSLPLYAIWDRTYTVTFNDQSTITNRTQASDGASVKVPNHTTPCTDEEHEPDEYTWTFAGWGTTPALSNSLTPNLVLNATTGAYNADYTPTEDITLYAVYQKTTSTSPTFQNGKSGAYNISAVNGSGVHEGETCYPTSKYGSGYYCSTTAPVPQLVVYFTYNEAGTYAGLYTIQSADGYYASATNDAGSFSWKSTPDATCYLKATSVTGGWQFEWWNGSGTGSYFTHDSRFGQFRSAGDPLILTPTAGSTYFTTMTCASSFDMTFNMSSGVIDYGSGSSADYLNKPDGTVISTFPTATLDGWTFIGWTAGSQYNDLYDVSGYYSDQNSSNIDPISDPSVGGAIYGGIYGGTTYTMHSDIVMYPVFTKLEDNNAFDEINGGDYYIYYLADYSPISPYSQNDRYAGAHRVYATGFTGAVNCTGTNTQFTGTMNCENATVFTFTKLANGNWTIYDNTKHGYVTGKSDNGLQECTSDDTGWSFVQSGSKWILTYTSGKAFIANDLAHGATSAEFQNFNISSLTSQPTMYHYVYIGSCTERIFSSNPSTTPEIDLKGTAVVTASQNGAVRGTNVLTVSGHNLTPTTGEITITSNNSDVYFSKTTAESFAAGIAAASNPQSSITVTANGSGIVTPTSIYVHYKPSSNTDAVTDVTVTATSTGATDATTTIKVRCVKENFAIAAKVGDSWYALPANMSTSNVYAPTLIEVDETNKIAYGPSTVAYKMWPVKTTNGGGNRYGAAGDLVRFAGNSDNALWANNAVSGTTTGIRNWAVVNSLTSGGSGSGEDVDERYEWVISTEDGDAYTINTNQSNNKRDLVIYRKNGQLVWATNGTYVTNELHLIPLTERATITIIPREWKTNGFVFMVNADNLISAVTYKIGTGYETSTTYTRHSTGGYGLYEVALPDLTSHYGKTLTLKMTISGVATYATVTIPIIVNANASTKTNEPFATLGAATKDYDVVVLDGKTLTTDATASGACKFQNLYIYAGGTLINDNSSTSVSYLEMRGGIKGVAHKSDLAQGVPHLMLNKQITSTAGANLDMSVNVSHSYALSVPFDVTVSSINYVYAYNLNAEGAAINAVLDKHYLLMEYDGAQRAGTGKGWKHITSTSRVLHAGEGYVLQAKRPTGQPFAVIRIPFSGVGSWADSYGEGGESGKSAISITANNGGANTPENDKGWNLIANPYMATLSYNGQGETWAANFKCGTLTKHPDEEHWDGTYQWTDKTNVYITMPNDWYTEFPQYRANSSYAVFEPFKNFFIQTESGGSVTFDKARRATMPRYLMAQTDQADPIYADINLTHGEDFAQAGIVVDANATTGYKFGEDQNIFENREALTYLKVYTVADGHYLVGNTLTPAETAELIPLEFYAPNANGEYVFSLDENSDSERLEYVILYDAELNINTNLLTGSYAVELDKTGLIENRFSIGLKIKEEEHVTTGTGDVDDEAERPFKFIHNDKMYILRNGKLYDATGKMVREINK